MQTIDTASSRCCSALGYTELGRAIQQFMSIWISNTKTKGHDKLARSRSRRSRWARWQDKPQRPRQEAASHLLEGDCCCSNCCCCCCCMLHVAQRQSRLNEAAAAKLSAESTASNRLIRFLSYLRTICRCCCSGINTPLPCWPQDANNSQAKLCSSMSNRNEALWPPAWPQVEPPASRPEPRDFNLTPFGGIFRLPRCLLHCWSVLHGKRQPQQTHTHTVHTQQNNQPRPHTSSSSASLQYTHVLHVRNQNRSKYWFSRFLMRF